MAPTGSLGDARLTLENFDETNAAARPILSSPRSIEACRMLGVEPHELVQQPLEHFLQQAKGEDRELVAKRAARYEKTRQQQLRNVRAQRRELLEAELSGVHGGMSLRTRSYCRSPVGGALGGGSTSSQHEFTVIAREKKELERIQQRQALEVQQMLQLELRQAELQAERERQDREQRRQAELQAKERTQRQREADELKRRQELEKAEQNRRELEHARKEAQARQMELVRREQRAKQEEERRRRDAQQSDKERQRRQEEARLQAELYQLAQEREVAQKTREMAAREQRRLEQRERQKRAKAQELALKQQRNSARVASVLQDHAQQRKVLLEAAAHKHQQSEERRRQFEADRQAREQEVRHQAQRKQQLIESVQTQLANMEQQRRERLREQERQAAARLAQRERDKQTELERHRREEAKLERERRRVYERMEARQRLKRAAILSKTEEKAATAQQMQEHKYALVRARLQEAKLREEEIQAALARKNKQDAYRSALLLARIESDDQRTRQLKEQRANLIRRRQQIKQTASRHKHEILESFYKMKVTKKFELPKHLAASLSGASGGRPRSASATMLHTRSLSTPETSVDIGGHNATVQKDTRVGRRPMSAMSRRSRTAADTYCQRPATTRSYPGPLNDDSGDDDGDEHDVDGEEQLENTNNEVVNELRRRQNEELLQLLEEEHHAEEQREHLLRQAGTDRRERARMEKLFDTERAHASERIMELTDRHERALAAQIDTLNKARH